MSELLQETGHNLLAAVKKGIQGAASLTPTEQAALARLGQRMAQAHAKLLAGRIEAKPELVVLEAELAQWTQNLTGRTEQARLAVRDAVIKFFGQATQALIGVVKRAI
jgi:hypothetical protein